MRSQTPLNRKLSKQIASKAPGTERRRNATQYFRVKQAGVKTKKKELRPRHSKSFKRSVTILGISGYLIMLALTALIGAISLSLAGGKQGDQIRFQLGSDSQVISRKYYPFSSLYKNGIYYIDMDSLADYCDLTATGNEKSLRYVVRSTGEEVEFFVGDSVAYVNGVAERTGGITYVIGEKLYVPLEFAARCFRNLDITLDEERGRITIIRAVDDKDQYIDVSFPHKVPVTADGIVFGQLEVAIQEQIIAQNQPQIPETEAPDIGGDDTEN